MHVKESYIHMQILLDPSTWIIDIDIVPILLEKPVKIENQILFC